MPHLSRQILLLSLLVPICSIFAAIPRYLSFQGVLTDKSGNILLDSTYQVAFSLYPDSVGGTSLWTESQAVISRHGVFTTQLGKNNALMLSFDKPYYLGLRIGETTELTPRTPLFASAYCLRADSAEYAAHAKKADTASIAKSIDTAASIRIDQLTVKKNIVVGGLLRVTGTIIADSLYAQKVSFLNHLPFSSFYTLPAKVTIAPGDTEEVGFPMHLRLRGIPYRYALWVNVEGDNDVTQTTNIQILRYEVGNGKWYPDNDIGKWTVSGRNWLDYYTDLNISKITNHFKHWGSSNFAIVNEGSKNLEVFAVGVIADGAPEEKLYIQK